MSQQTAHMPTLDEAIAITVEYLRTAMAQGTGPRGNYGYDLWAPTVANAWALSACGTETLRRESAARRASPIFFEAAWELCRRGVLRPGIRETGAQAVSGGLGYSITAQGREWLFSGDSSHFVMLQPGALAAALATYRERFGNGYHQRAQEAVRCRDAEAWFSACAMVGAAAESIVLATAVAKSGTEAPVLKGYASANGQKKLLNDLAPATKPHLARPLATVTGLLAYWRDEAAYAMATPISGLETEQALRELLQFAQFVNENWDDLTLSAKAASAKAAAKAVEAKAQIAVVSPGDAAAKEALPAPSTVAPKPLTIGTSAPPVSIPAAASATMSAPPALSVAAPFAQERTPAVAAPIRSGAASDPTAPASAPAAAPAPTAETKAPTPETATLESEVAATKPNVEADTAETIAPSSMPSKPVEVVMASAPAVATGPGVFLPLRTGGLPIKRDPAPVGGTSTPAPTPTPAQASTPETPAAVVATPPEPQADADTPATEPKASECTAPVTEEAPTLADPVSESKAEAETAPEKSADIETPQAAPAVVNARRWW